jgi:purine-cytosine permease-like protein
MDVIRLPHLIALGLVWTAQASATTCPADWTQYIDEANAYWATHKMTGFGSDQ